MTLPYHEHWFTHTMLSQNCQKSAFSKQAVSPQLQKRLASSPVMQQILQRSRCTTARPCGLYSSPLSQCSAHLRGITDVSSAQSQKRPLFRRKLHLMHTHGQLFLCWICSRSCSNRWLTQALRSCTRAQHTPAKPLISALAQQFPTSVRQLQTTAAHLLHSSSSLSSRMMMQKARQQTRHP